jgi:site-specific DNA recombinase
MSEFPKTGLRIAIYARVSTEEQREGQTIDSQIAELERFSRERTWLVVATYKDDGWSGGIMERPQLDRLRDDAENGSFDAVLINDVDRLARDVSHLGVIKRDLERKGVQVVFRKLPGEKSPTYNLMVNILGSFAEFERELIADRTRRGRRHKVETRKLYLGSNTAYGYSYLRMDRAGGAEGVLQIMPQEAEVVRNMFAWVDEEGLSAHRVVTRLNELHIPPRKGAPTWGKSSVLRILKSETYAGTWHYNKFQACEPRQPAAANVYRKRSKCSVRQRPSNEWVPLELPETLRIVSRERWVRVQQQLVRNRAFSVRNEKHSYLLKGLVRCGGCGAMYGGDPCHGKFYYRCTMRCKQMPSIREDILNDAVMLAISGIMTDPKVILEPLRQIEQGEAAEAKAHLGSEHRLEKEATRLAGEEQRLLDAYRTGLISPAQLGVQLEKIGSSRAALDLERASAVPPKVPVAHIDKAVTEYCAEAAANLDSLSPEDWRQMCQTLIESAVFYGNRIVIRGRIRLEELNNEGPELSVEAPVAARPAVRQ